jgi:hypothetical protein
MHKVYSATVTAHQAVRGKLAAWPYYIQVIPLMKYLGVRPSAMSIPDTTRYCRTSLISGPR